MNKLNINGEHVLQKGYITDELTDYALGYLANRVRQAFSYTCPTKQFTLIFLPQNATLTFIRIARFRFP